MLLTRIGPHISMCRSSHGLVVLTIFFDLKELLTYLPLMHTSHEGLWLYSKVGTPLTRSLLTCMVCILMNPIAIALDHPLEPLNT